MLLDGKDYVTIQNLAIRYAGAHGIQANGYRTSSDHLIIEYCDIAFVGGSYLSGTIRYGNGIEIYDAASDIVVRSNSVDNAYDAAFTTQGAEAGDKYSGHFYCDNIASNSEYGFEFWIVGSGSSMNGLYVSRNVFRDNGGGWGHTRRPDPYGTGLMLWDSVNGGLSNCVFESKHSRSVRVAPCVRLGTEPTLRPLPSTTIVTSGTGSQPSGEARRTTPSPRGRWHFRRLMRIATSLNLNLFTQPLAYSEVAGFCWTARTSS